MEFFSHFSDWFHGLRTDPNSMGSLALVKSVITALCVATVLWMGRKFGDRASGVLAGLPIVTAPTLMWLATQPAPDFAIRAAVNSMSATAAYAFFALFYAHLCTRLRALYCLAVALALSLLIASLFVSIPASRIQTLIAALALCAAIRWFMPAPAPDAASTTTFAATKPPLQIPIWAVATNAGVVCGAIIYFGAHLPAHWVGMLASVPIIGATIAIAAHVRLGVTQARRGLIGYVEGSGVKVVFCFAFAEMLRGHGIWLATLTAVAASAAMVVSMNTRSFFASPKTKSGQRNPDTSASVDTRARVSNAPTPATISW
jgi:hypothetical protein